MKVTRVTIRLSIFLIAQLLFVSHIWALDETITDSDIIDINKRYDGEFYLVSITNINIGSDENIIYFRFRPDEFCAVISAIPYMPKGWVFIGPARSNCLNCMEGIPMQDAETLTMDFFRSFIIVERPYRCFIEPLTEIYFFLEIVTKDSKGNTKYYGIPDENISEIEPDKYFEMQRIDTNDFSVPNKIRTNNLYCLEFNDFRTSQYEHVREYYIKIKNGYIHSIPKILSRSFIYSNSLYYDNIIGNDEIHPEITIDISDTTWGGWRPFHYFSDSIVIESNAEDMDDIEVVVDFYTFMSRPEIIRGHAYVERRCSYSGIEGKKHVKLRKCSEPKTINKWWHKVNGKNTWY